MDEKIICIFCGNMARMILKNGQTVFNWGHCKREMQIDAYQKMLDQWLGDVRDEAEGVKR